MLQSLQRFEKYYLEKFGMQSEQVTGSNRRQYQIIDSSQSNQQFYYHSILNNRN